MNVRNEIESKAQSAGRSAVWYTLAVFFTRGLGFVTIPIFTRIMSTEEFGLFNNYAAWQIILLVVFGLESYATLNRARLDFNGRALREYQFTMLSVSLLFTLLLVAALLLAPSALEAAVGLDSRYLWLMVLYLLFSPSFAMFQALQRVQYRYKLSASLTFASSLIATLLAVWLVLSLPDALLGRIVGQYAPFTVVGLLLYIWYCVRGGRFRVKYLRYALPLCLPLVISSLGSQILLLGCRIVTQHMCGSDDVAYLSLATTLANIVIILTTALGSAWAPFFYDCIEAKEYKRASSTFSLFAWGTAVLVVAASLLAPELVRLLGGDRYLPTIWLAPSFLSACLFNLLAAQYVSLETYHKDLAAGGVVTLVVAVLNLLLCAAFIVLFGFDSVGYANVVSGIVLILAHKIIVRRFDTPDFFALRHIGLPCVLVLIAIPFCTALYALQWHVARWVLCAIVAMLGVFVLLRFRKTNTERG